MREKAWAPEIRSDAKHLRPRRGDVLRVKSITNSTQMTRFFAFALLLAAASAFQATMPRLIRPQVRQSP